MSSARITSIQCLRAIAATLVLVVHGAESIGHTGVAVSGEFMPTIPNLGPFGASGVDLFFVISGFVMAQSIAGQKMSAWRFLVLRWLRIVPFFFIMSAAFLAICRGPIAPQSLLMSATILPVFDGADYHAPALFVGWTLGFEFAFYALVAIAVTAGRRRIPVLLALTIGAAACGLVVHPAWAPLRLLFNPLQLEFALGVAVWAAWRKGWTLRCAGPALAAGMLLLGTGIAFSLGLRVNAHYLAAVDGTAGLARTWTWGLPWALVTVGVIDLRGSGRLAGLLSRTGDASYATYLVHPCIIAALALGTLTFPAIGAPIYVALFVIGATGTGMVLHAAGERPLLRMLRRHRAPGFANRTLFLRA